MKLWVDDVRPASEGYVWVKTVHMAKEIIEVREEDNHPFELIDIDYDAGDYGPPDYYKILDWLEETGRNYPIRIHSMNPVGIENMRRIIQRNGWTEVK